MSTINSLLITNNKKTDRTGYIVQTDQLLIAFKKGMCNYLYPEMSSFHGIRVEELLKRTTLGSDYQPISKDDHNLPLGNEYDPYWREVGAFITKARETGLEPEKIYSEIRQWVTSTDTHLKTT